MWKCAKLQLKIRLHNNLLVLNGTWTLIECNQEKIKLFYFILSCANHRGPLSSMKLWTFFYFFSFDPLHSTLKALINFQSILAHTHNAMRCEFIGFSIFLPCNVSSIYLSIYFSNIDTFNVMAWNTKNEWSELNICIQWSKENY